MTSINSGVNPFLSTPSFVTSYILTYCEGVSTDKISQVCKLLLNKEKEEKIWKDRVVHVLGQEMSKQFFETYQSWKTAYINLFHMSQGGKILSPTKILDDTGTIQEGQFFKGRLSGQGKMIFNDGSEWNGTFLDGEFVKGEKISDDGEAVIHFDANGVEREDSGLQKIAKEFF